MRSLCTYSGVTLLFASAILSLASGGALAETASVYSKRLDGRPMANGRPYRHGRISVAHKTLPLGTWVSLRSCATGRSVTAQVTDRGPFVRGRTFDLSGGAAHALGVSGLPCVISQVLGALARPFGPAENPYAWSPEYKHRYRRRHRR